MKEFTIEDFTIDFEKLNIEYYFYSEFKQISFSKEQIIEVFGTTYLDEWFLSDFNQEDCIKILKYFVRDYAKKK